MFCFLEQIELETNTCPVKCMYRGKDKTCEYKALTPDVDESGFDIHVTAKTVSDVKGIKLYRVKESVAKARVRIKVGLVIMKYVEFLKLKVNAETLEEHIAYLKYAEGNSSTCSISSEHEAVEALLLQEFGLGITAQQFFFDKKTFDDWAKDKGIDLDFSTVVNTLVYAAKLRLPSVDEQDQEPNQPH